MSAMITSAALSRDLRAEHRPFKQDRDHRSKWNHGFRPLPGKRWSELHALEDNDDVVEGLRVRPARQARHQPAMKRYGPGPNRDTKSDNSSINSVKTTRKTLPLDSAPLTRSLLDLLPTHANNTPSIVLRASASVPCIDDAGVLYSFDAPTTPGKRVELGGLVELAEKQWVEAQTEKMVKDDYEVLDSEGAVVQMGRGKKAKGPKKARADSDFMDDFEIVDLDCY